jgi:hypothetical protein
MMTLKALTPFTLLFAIATFAAYSDEPKHHAAQLPKSARFDQLKQLAGDWIGKEKVEGGKDVQVNYKVTSGGSAVVETLMPGTDHEMVTVIHPDGDNLLLTHYCMLGNQPQMKAPLAGDAKTIAFKFAGATNMKSPMEMHMHDLTYTFVDKDTLKAEWTHYMEGKPAGNVVFELKRKQ